ncbi:MAG: extracellular solute-binding protein [Gammaproteobacteria bacterium]|nr:extracellular solute-binding protein [Gammaproteobacteria bacterium]
MKRSFNSLILLGLASILGQNAVAESLVVYSGRSDKFVKPVAEAFTKETGIQVVLHSGKSTELLNKLKLEGGRTEADLYLSNDAGNLQKGAELGLFQPVSGEIANQIPQSNRAADNSWIGLSARARVLVVNSKSPEAEHIHSVFDLAKPEMKGKIGITYSTNESFIAGASVYMQEKGKDATLNWLKGLKENSNGKQFNKHSHVVKEVADGKAVVGLVNHYYIFRHLDKEPNAPIRIVVPDQDGMGIAWNVAGIAVTKHTNKKALAEKFVRFLISDKGQQMFAEVNNEYPVRPDVATAPQIPKRSSITIASTPMESLGKLRDETIDLIEAAGLP